MLPRPAEHPFDSADHLFEPSWARRTGPRLHRASRSGAAPPRGRRRVGTWPPVLPELADLGSRIVARSAVIDGEVVVVDDRGRPDPAALRTRLAGGSGPPVAYLVFDLLVLDGRPILGEPLHRRRRELHRLLTPGDTVVAVPAIAGEGLALHAAVERPGYRGDDGAGPDEPLPAGGAEPAVATDRGRAARSGRRPGHARPAGRSAADDIAGPRPHPPAAVRRGCLGHRCPGRARSDADAVSARGQRPEWSVREVSARGQWPARAAARNWRTPGRWPYMSTPTV